MPALKSWNYVTLFLVLQDSDGGEQNVLGTNKTIVQYFYLSALCI